jgi:hypothetical protein
LNTCRARPSWWTWRRVRVANSAGPRCSRHATGCVPTGRGREHARGPSG